MIPDLMSTAGQETVPVAPLPEIMPGQPFSPPASPPPVPYAAAPPYPLYTLAPPVVYSPDFPKTLVRRLTRTHTFRAGLIFVILSFLFNLVRVVLTVAAEPSLLRTDYFLNFTQSHDSMYLLISNSGALLVSLVLIVALIRLSGSHKAADLPLFKALGLLTAVPIVACVGTFFSSFASILLVDLPSLHSTIFSLPDFQASPWAYWLIAVLAVLLLAAIFIPLYYFAFAGFRNIRDAVKTGIPSARFCTFIVVILFILAFSALSSPIASLLGYFGEELLNFAGLYTYHYGILDFVSMAQTFLSGLSSLFLGITLSRYVSCTKKGILP